MSKTGPDEFDGVLNVFENWARKQKRVTTASIGRKWGCNYTTSLFWFHHLIDAGIIDKEGNVND